MTFLHTSSCMKRLMSFCLSLLSMLPGAMPTVQGQTLKWEDYIDELLSSSDLSGDASSGEDAGWENVVEELTELHLHPLNFNAATPQELEQLPFLSARQIEEILYHRDLHGPFHDAGELMLIPLLDYATRQRLVLFVTFEPQAEGEWSSSSVRGTTPSSSRRRNEAMVRTDVPLYTRAGYRPFTLDEWQQHPAQHYWGNALHVSARYASRQADGLGWGFAMEKDAGEPFLTRGVDGQWLGRKGFDYYGGYLQLKNRGMWRNVTVGNYHLQFGQGLIMNTRYALGKGMLLDGWERRLTGDVISGHGGTNESDYLRGAAATARVGLGTEVTMFVSYRRYDATLAGDSVQTFLITGLHRTSSEIDRAGTVEGWVAGGHVVTHRDGLHIGATALWRHYDPPLGRGAQLYRAHRPIGRQQANVGVDYAYCRPSLTVTGETALSLNGGWATLNTLRFEPWERVGLTLLQRCYSVDYWATQANAFGDGSEVRGEEGLYVGTDVRVLRNWRLTAYADLYRFPMARYRVDDPSHGSDINATATYAPRDGRITVSMRYRWKLKQRNPLAEYRAVSCDGLQTEVTQRARLQATTVLSSMWTLTSTADFCLVDAEQRNKGVRLGGRIGYAPSARLTAESNGRISLDGEASWFYTTDYAARLYGYERGLLYAYNYRAYAGHGLRAMIMVNMSLLGNRLVATAKLSGTHYFDRDVIGSQAEQIASNHAEDVALQLRWKW